MLFPMLLRQPDRVINQGLELFLIYNPVFLNIWTDFILGDKEVALEIKSGKIVHGIELKSLKALQEDGPAKYSVVVCCEKYPREVGNISILPWTIFLEKLWAGDFGV